MVPFVRLRFGESHRAERHDPRLATWPRRICRRLGRHSGAGGGASTTVSLPVLNPAPNVASLSPSTVGVGAAGFTLTVTGSSFVPSSVVQWNGVNRTTSFGNAATLFATIPATDLSVAGSAAITVVTPAPGGGNLRGHHLADREPSADA